MGPMMRCLLLSFLLLLSGLVQAGEVLRVLAWPGYADADLVRQFEARHRVRVDVITVDSDDELWRRMRANEGRDIDVFAVNTAELQRYINEGIALALDPARIPRIQFQQPAFRDAAAIPGLTRGGRVYGVPYAHASMGLIYNRKLVSTPPDSINALWDPRYRGQVLAFDGSSHNFSLAAMALGKPPFKLAAGDWRPVLEKLIGLRRNVLTFYAQPEEAVELFRSNAVALLFANYGSQQVRALEDAGADIAYVIPREGALAWLDCWVINSASLRRKLAEAWIDFSLEAPMSRALTERHGLANTLDPDKGEPGGGLIWLQPVEDVERRTRLWEKIRAGDRLERF